MKMTRCALALIAVLGSLAIGAGTQAADLIVSANDAKFHRVAGKDTGQHIPLSGGLTSIRSQPR